MYHCKFPCASTSVPSYGIQIQLKTPSTRPTLLSRCTPTTTTSTTTFIPSLSNSTDEDSAHQPLIDSGSGSDNNDPPTNDDGNDHFGWDDNNEPPRGSWVNPFAYLALGVHGRLRADPFFLHKLGIECALDALIIISVNLAARQKRFIPEIEFTLCQLAISLFSDFALVYLLAPSTVRSFSRPGSFRSKIETLPSHVFQRAIPGSIPFTAQQRFAAFFLKAFQYGAVGLAMGGLGAFTVKALVTIREEYDPTFVPPDSVQSIKGTGLAWSGFMSTSSNVRYNLVNMCEDALYMKGAGAGKLGSVALRLINNWAGAVQWVALTNKLNLNQPWIERKRRRKN